MVVISGMQTSGMQPSATVRAATICSFTERVEKSIRKSKGPAVTLPFLQRRIYAGCYHCKVNHQNTFLVYPGMLYLCHKIYTTICKKGPMNAKELIRRITFIKKMLCCLQ